MMVNAREIISNSVKQIMEAIYIETMEEGEEKKKELYDFMNEEIHSQKKKFDGMSKSEFIDYLFIELRKIFEEKKK